MLPADRFLSSPWLPGSTMKLTPGAGITLLIGIAGSIFLVAQSHRLLRSKLSQRRRSSRKPDAAECYMCNANVELETPDSFATCRGCEKLVCRGENCCQWVESIGIWECTGCQSNRVIQQKAGEWLLNQLTVRLKHPGPVELKDGNLLGLGLDTDDARSTTSSTTTTVSANQRVKVREFIEELLSAMLHGPLDDVSVGQLMKHESYLPLWEGQQQHHSPSDQHFELKRLIQKILEEIAKLPELLNHSGLPLRPEEHLPYFDPKKYEQLLATAVLNKVVDDYRNPKNFTDGGDVAGKGQTGAGATPYTGTTVDINHNQLSETGSSRSLLSKESLRQMSVTADDQAPQPHEGVSYSAIGTERRLSDTDESYLSDYIQRHKVPLPDLSDTTGSGSGAEDDDLQSLKSNATDGTWEENWLFRKRQLKTTESSIAMLVPSPTEEVKALIGDKNADEISDLSEAGSDCEGYESDGNVNGGTVPSVAPVVVASSSKDTTSEGISSSSKTQSLDEILPPDSLVSINSLPVNEEALSEATNSQLLADQVAQNGGSERLQVDDLISIEPVADRVETTNPTLTNPFLDDVFEANNNVITDDVKMLQRTETGDNRSSATESNGYGDRKEIPIDRAHPSPSNPVAVDSEVVVAVPPLADSSPTNGNGSSVDSSVETDSSIDSSSVKTNKLEFLKQPEVLLDSRSPPDSPVQQVLSPHPIMMTITDVFDRLANSSPLTAISEEQPPAVLDEMVDSEPPTLEAIAEECSGLVEEKHPVLSPSDSVQVEQDDSEYRTISEATNNSLLLADSFEGLESFDTYEPGNDEFCSLMEPNDSDRTPEPGPSPDLLQIRETPPAALYVCNQDQIEFAEQLRSLEEDATKQHDPFERTPDDQPTRVSLQPDLVTFDNNAPSPDSGPPGIVAVTEQMRAYCEELKAILNLPEDEEPSQELSVPLEPEPEQWEIVDTPEALEALEQFQNELLIAVSDPTQTDVRPCSNHAIREEPLLELEDRFPSPIEVAGLQMAQYSDNLKSLEYVEEGTVMDEETLPLPDASIDRGESPQALLVSSEDSSQPIVTVSHTPSTEPEPSITTVSLPGEEHPPTSTEETMLTSMESRDESKIEDTSMPAFSDTELLSLSSPFTSFSLTNSTINNNNNNNNNCMPTNISLTEQGPNHLVTNHTSNNTNPSIEVGESALDVDPEQAHVVESVADVCSLVPAQIATNGGDVPEVQGDSGEQDASEDAPDTLIPGSIAEREHLKWRNAKPIANNPYSPDVLQRRLSEKTRPSSMIEIDRLVRKEAAPATGGAPGGVLIDDEEPPKEPTDSGTENDRSLQSVTGGVLTETKKIGREYYINDPERLRAGGAPLKSTLGPHTQTQQPSHSTDDEKSLLLGRAVDENEAAAPQKLTPEPVSSLYRSSSVGKQRDPRAEDIFAARPVQVTADDPILQQGTKVSYLSTAAREIYLVPVESEPNGGSLMSSSSELSSVHSPTNAHQRPELDSLTYSEDSDVTRIYDLTTGEAKVVRAYHSESEPPHDTILQILPQPSPTKQQPAMMATAPSHEQSSSSSNVSALKSQLSTGERADAGSYHRRSPFPVKPLSPETIKFFAPKRKLSFTGSTNSLVSESGGKGAGSEQGTTHVLPSMHSSLHIDFPASRSATGSEFAIIEKDVIDVLPSVKELAKCYSGSTSDVSTLPPKPLYKPRDFIRQSSDVLNEEGMPNTKGQRQYSSTSSIAVRDEIREIRKLNLEAYRQSTYYPMAPGHSITARSLSKQIREHKSNVTDDHKVGHHQQEEQAAPAPLVPGGADGELNGTDADDEPGHASPERPASPVLLPGHLKSSIQFFESLKNKP
uniref:FYVE-type zinc finger domain-containing protein n=1 Tax=Anopheles quadriannulatus TaxID=34691 RepID=A0A1Y9J061_ANOQN